MANLPATFLDTFTNHSEDGGSARWDLHQLVGALETIGRTEMRPPDGGLVAHGVQETRKRMIF
jgi:hypothetical protein